MPTFRNPFHRPDTSTEARFLAWTDELFDTRSLSDTGTTPDPDFADVAETATTVHRAAGPGAATPLPTDRTDAIWEQLMNTTTTVSPAALSGAAVGNDPPATDSDRPSSVPRPGWSSYLLTAALIAVIVVASAATIWRITDPLNGSDPGTSSQPGFVASATPAQETRDGCPLTSDMFVIIDEESSPDDVATLLPTTAIVQEDGDFVIICDGVDDPAPLMSSVTNAESLPWPGTVLLELEGRDAIAYNIATGEQIDLGDFDLVAALARTDLASPWLATPNNPAYTDWRLTHLGTMDSMILSEEIGGVLPAAWYPEITWSPGSPVAIVAEGPDYGRTNLTNADSATIAELPSNAVVIDETFEIRRWIDTWGDIAVSANGEAIAYQETDPVRPLRVEDARTGQTFTELPGFNVNDRSSGRFAFSGDGKSLIYLNGNDIRLATYEGEPTTTLLETGSMRPSEVYATGVPGRVLIQRITDGPNSTSGFDYSPMAISILDTDTGNITDVEGIHVDYGYGISDPWKYLDYVVTMASVPESDATMVVHLSDIATGEVVLSSEPIELSMQMLVDQFAQALFAKEGAIMVMTLVGGPHVLFDVNAEAVGIITTDHLNDIEGFEGIDWVIAPITGGHYLAASGYEAATSEQFVTVSPLSVVPEWVLPPTTIPAGVIRAIPAEPEDNDEPTTLDAQEITPLEASPAANPATPKTSASSDCDLTRDILVVTDLDATPWSGTILLLSDGTLTLRCDGTSTGIADGVAEVRGTGWPGAFVATMEDGTLHGVNLLTGATGDLGPETVLTDSVAGSRSLGAAPGSPWMGIPANVEMTDWRFVDLRTMESMLLSDEIGGQLPRSTVSSLYAFTPDAAVIGFPGYVPNRSGSLSSAATPAPGATVSEMSVVQETALVIDGSLENRRWTDVSFRTMTPATISLDGELLAVEQPTDGGMTVRVERLSDGEVVADTGIDLEAEDTFVVLNDKTGLLHLTDDRLDLVTWDTKPTIETLLELETGQGSLILEPTADPEIVIASIVHEHGPSVGYLVNAVTGETAAIPNLVRTPFLAYASFGVPPRYVLAAAYTGDDGGQAALYLIGVTSGDVAVEQDVVDAGPAAELAMQPAFLRSHGTIGVISHLPDRAIVLNATTGESFEIQAPVDVEGVSNGQKWFFYPSADGRFITAVPDRQDAAPLFVRQLARDAEWVELPDDALTTIVSGSQSLPEAPSAP